MDQASESKRVKRFRDEIIRIIPRVPNNRETLQALQEKSLTDLLIVYGNWAIRFVGQWKRKVVIEDSAKKDKRWALLNEQIERFLKKVKNGDDLTPFLSLKARKRGYSLAADKPDSSANSWDDKDFLLNVMGYHHFHLGELRDDMQHAERTNDVLFADVSRDTFTVLAILDHSVFEQPKEPLESMAKDREVLWSIFNEHATKEAMPGSLIVPSIIATSGHSFNTVMSAQEYVRVIRTIDPKLDDPEFVQSLYEGSGLDAKDIKKLNWHFRHLDLGVLDESTGFFGVFRYGPN